MSNKILEVAVGVIQRTDGTFLMAQRPQDKDCAGYWEFPGGKVETDESPYQALVRELQEELGVVAQIVYPWMVRVFTYPHATVRLNFFRVTAWKGDPQGLEGQLLSWQSISNINVEPMLPANKPILRALTLPTIYAISNATELGVEGFLLRLQKSLNNGLKLVQIREKGWGHRELLKLSLKVVALAHAAGARVLINENIELAKEVGADGVQLTGKQLATSVIRPDVELCAASCHNAEELERANELELDFALLSPVLPTKSHPGAAHLGWDEFAKIAQCSAIPVFALGGMKLEDRQTAWEKGAHGIALLRQAW